MNEFHNGFRSLSREELEQIEGGVAVGTFFGNIGKLRALQMNGANVSAPPLGGRDSYYPSGGGINRGDGFGNPFGING
jgi:hypothetical protein